MSVYKKLQSAKVALHSMESRKSGTNSFAGYSYFELGDFLPNIVKVFNGSGLCSVITFNSDLAILRIVDVDDMTEIVITSPMSSATLKGCHPVQNIGAVETYQRRYLYMAALDIVEHDAIDSSESEKIEHKPKINFKFIAASITKLSDSELSERNALIQILKDNGIGKNSFTENVRPLIPADKLSMVDEALSGNKTQKGV